MSACGTSTKPAVWPILPANLGQPCPPVPEVTSDNWDDLARSYMALAVQYGECAVRHGALLKAWATP
ncbi:Rz1-like lysis system protein LysC [Achromobacter sp. UBA4530]|uniref:Rz1-like lysis system protein LysC n=1 Tax=Achromobacter TaxID=222 RepID=UPI003BB8AAB5